MSNSIRLPLIPAAAIAHAAVADTPPALAQDVFTDGVQGSDSDTRQADLFVSDVSVPGSPNSTVNACSYAGFFWAGYVMKINATQPDIEFIDYSAPRLPDTNWRIRINVSGSLAHVQAFIDGNCHLPEVPCEAQRRAGGMDMAEMQMDRLKKIEAPTLYTLEQEDRIPRLEAAL